MMAALMPLWIESLPSVGSTSLKLVMETGVFRGFWSTLARAKASWSVKSPSITPFPFSIGELIRGGGLEFAVQDDGQLAAHVVPGELAKTAAACGIEGEGDFRPADVVAGHAGPFYSAHQIGVSSDEIPLRDLLAVLAGPVHGQNRYPAGTTPCWNSSALFSCTMQNSR